MLTLPIMQFAFDNSNLSVATAYGRLCWGNPGSAELSLDLTATW